MKQLFLLSVLSIFLFSCKCTTDDSKCNNSDSLSVSKKSEYEHLTLATLWYQKSAEMRAIYYQCYNWATRLLDEKLLNNKDPRKKAVIVDIDETLLNNSPFEVKCIETGKGYSSESWKNWSDKAIAEALPGAVDFLNYAKEKNVEVFYISNRKVIELESTAKNLKAHNFPFVDEKHMIFKTTENSKKMRRDSLKTEYEFLLLIGDNLTDFNELYENRDSKLGIDFVDSNKADFGDIFIMLPNPMYGEWETAIYNNNNRISDFAKDSLRKANLKSY
ncbi:MAG: 5'-nucleotidase, lipoprotein e(P4) family [Bacteroidetes bacterium GWA2_31_9]|nr:MAG: 5'-nucleotidase, lipoprotein e(P4) family [Bacteroidetes bacterium GWA2_31_9]